MRWVLAAAATLLTFVAAVAFRAPDASTGPEPILYGRDTCAFCRMHLSQPGFAAEMRLPGGTLAKYDDPGCLALAAAGQTPVAAWVEDNLSGRLLALDKATFVRGGELQTPMGHGVLAFEDPGVARAFASAHKAAVLPLQSILQSITTPKGTVHP
ncbi:MAG: nitrous oxide reductase accessory protein NosL [Candidatus Wallbacteria bacterium]|nr:nitrous oxide reductase accessory protein NosL [Candidatus Wallbacteria bacterium]